jgi:DNA processing protein
LDAQPDAGHFPTRNRIISGMSLGVTIVEAAPKSGSLITANLALEQGREVFAVPGSVDALRSRGAHELIRQGAHLVESAEDILRELGAILQAWGKDISTQGAVPEEIISLAPHEEQIIALIDETPVHIDKIIEKSGLGPAITTATLLELELKGLVRQTAGKQFHRIYARNVY